LCQGEVKDANATFQGVFEARKQAVLAIAAVIKNSSEVQAIILIDHGIIKPMCNLITAKDEEVKLKTLLEMYIYLWCGLTGTGNQLWEIIRFVYTGLYKHRDVCVQDIDFNF
jgi:hypothetical protein